MTTGNPLFDAAANKAYQAVKGLLDSHISILPWKKLTYREKEESWWKSELEKRNIESSRSLSIESKEISLEDEIDLTKKQVEQYDQESQRSWFHWAWRNIVGQNHQITLKRYWLYHVEIKSKLNSGIFNKPLDIEDQKIEVIRKQVDDYDFQAQQSWRFWLSRHIFGDDNEIILKRRWLMYQYYKSSIEVLSSGFMIESNILLLAISNLKRMTDNWFPRNWQNVINSFKALAPTYLKIILRGKKNRMIGTSRKTVVTQQAQANTIEGSPTRELFQPIQQDDCKSQLSSQDEKHTQQSEIQLKILYQKYIYLCGFFGVNCMMDVIAISGFDKLKILQSELATDFKHAYMALTHLPRDERQELFGAAGILLTNNTQSLMNLIKMIGHLPLHPSTYLSAEEMQFAFQQGQEVSSSVRTTLTSAKSLIAREEALSEYKKSQIKSGWWPFRSQPVQQISKDTRVVLHPSVRFTGGGVRNYMTELSIYHYSCGVLGLNPFDPEQEVTLDKVKDAYGKLKTEYQPDKAMGKQRTEQFDKVREKYDVLIMLLGTFFTQVHHANSTLNRLFKKYNTTPFMTTYPPLRKHLTSTYMIGKKFFDERPDYVQSVRQMIEDVREDRSSSSELNQKRKEDLNDMHKQMDDTIALMDEAIDSICQRYEQNPESVDLTAFINDLTSKVRHTEQRGADRKATTEYKVKEGEFDYDNELAKLRVMYTEKVNQRIQQLRQILQCKEMLSCSSPAPVIAESQGRLRMS